MTISKEDFEPRLEQTEIKIVELVTLQELAANFVDLCSERAAKNLKSCSKEIYTFVQLVTPTAETVRDLERKIEHDFARVEAREGHCNDGGLCITDRQGDDEVQRREPEEDELEGQAQHFTSQSALLGASP